MTFRIGQKVVCVDNRYAEKQLKLNGVYTVKNLLESGWWRWRDNIIMTQPVEVYETSPAKGMEGFHPKRFRPFDNRQTDISIFKKILITEKVDV